MFVFGPETRAKATCSHFHKICILDQNRRTNSFQKYKTNSQFGLNFTALKVMRGYFSKTGLWVSDQI